MNSSEEHQKYIQSQNKKKNGETNATEYIPRVDQPTNAMSVILPKTDILKQAEKVLSPLMFVKRKYKAKQESRCSRRLVVLENMLSAVVQAYYKSDYEIESVIRVLKNTVADAPVEEAKNVGITRRATKKQGTGGARVKPESEDCKPDLSEANKFMDGNDVLDYLVSPLKYDFEFGQLIRKLVA